MTKLKSLIFIFSITMLLMSCSNDDPEPMHQPDDLKVGLFADGEAITVPEAMLNSDNSYASLATTYLSISTAFSAYGSFFEIPDGASKKSQPITAANGRIEATQYSVYEWTGPDGAAVAYQYSEQEGQQVIEIFLKESGKDYLKIIEVIQSTDRKEGTMIFFDEQGPAMVWTWKVDNDGNYFLTYSSGNERYEIISNHDQSGRISLYINDALETEIIWDNKGNGSWKEYSDGTVSESGEWTV